MIASEAHALKARLDRAIPQVRSALWAERNNDGFWLGELASSALATATAVSALSVVEQLDHNAPGCKELIRSGVGWLVERQNSDGGWGDTTRSTSNISTAMLVRAALELSGDSARLAAVIERVSAYIQESGGATAVAARYGADRTFAVPILANCALAGLTDWREVAPLPFELACVPQQLYRYLRLHVVSYALPALIAIGQLIHSRCPSSNPIARLIRNIAVGRSLAKLESIQPTSGGFLEAIPLTSFVTMSLAAVHGPRHTVVEKGVEFLRNTVRPDGSWPIDSNLSTWLTTLSINALAADPSAIACLPSEDLECTRDWLWEQQLRVVHPYTNSPPGGWGWSHLSGSVPDADDTAGALLALSSLPGGDRSIQVADSAIHWLLGLQNSNGGWPTFCRGWGKLPFDRSGTDLTAHVIRAFLATLQEPSPSDSTERSANARRAYTEQLCRRAIARAFRYLESQQRADGAWVPLWFGNQNVVDDENPLYGTCKVLAAYVAAERISDSAASRALGWLEKGQNDDGGWGGSQGVPSSVEETALAVDVLAAIGGMNYGQPVSRGVQWLLDRVESGEWRNAAPIGLYFAKLWYFEKLYPMIYTMAALGRARRLWLLPLAPASP